MDNTNITKLSGLSKIHFTLEELEEMNKDMESIMRLMDSIKDVELPPESGSQLGTNIYPLRPDIVIPSLDPPQTGKYYTIPRIVE
ncbi:MAG: aspartyl/glutamyl-tRNA amidotransferase subunit C [Clostridiales bacterium]|jgi:Asp-tRNA(Asn)/Glu-tRNA(Gln) amidotransferase C subunit|nr:aspartyl/glutamyl-tRNA amidotransferase subunit C [Clostridiales bacterium]